MRRRASAVDSGPLRQAKLDRMILKSHIGVRQIFFSFRHSILSKIWPRVFGTTAAAVVMTYYEMGIAEPRHTLSTIPFSLIGVALGIFLGFRTSASYDRFWEGRKLWGRLVNVTRTFARQVEMFVVPSAGEDPQLAADCRRGIVLRTIAYVECFRALLRDEGTGRAGDRLDPAELAVVAARRNPPNAIVEMLAERLREAWRQGWIHDYHLPALDSSLTELTSIQGGCERIKNTPVPFSYSLLIHRITFFYCFLLPLGLLDTVGAGTPLVTFLICYAFFGLDAIGDEIENPFELEPNDLPLDTMTRNIEIDLLQMIGESAAPLAPVNDVMT